MFEYHGIGLWKDLTLERVVDELDTSYGYVCYLGGRPTLTRLTGCSSPEYEFKWWSNVLCGPRGHHGFAYVLESLMHVWNGG